MRKFIATPVVGGSPLTLGDDSAGDWISGGYPQSRNTVQTIQFFRAPFTTRFDRGNSTNVMAWVVNRIHADENTALDFVRDHPQAVAALGISNVEDIGPTDTRYWANAKITARCTRYDGQSSEFEYAMEAGAESTTAP